MEIKEFMERLSSAMVDHLEDEVSDIKTYEELGISTEDKGFEITMLDKSRFEVTITTTSFLNKESKNV